MGRAGNAVARAAFTGASAGLLRMRELSVLIVVVALSIYFAVSNPAFASAQNAAVIASFTASAAIIAAGEVMLLVSGELDLSVGMTFAMTPFILLWAMDLGAPFIVALFVALAGAALVGVVNGVVTVGLGVHSFITTLGTLFLVHGVTLIISGSFPKPAPSKGFVTQVLGGWPWAQILWAIVIVIVMHAVLTGTRWGTYTIATGGNPTGASEAGIKIRRIKMRNFIACAVLGGFAGIVEGIHVTQSFDPNAGGNELMFTAIAAAVIGGTALAGGSGTVIGAFLGAVVLGVLRNGFTLQGISANTYFVILGVAIIASMVLNTQLSRFRREAKAG
ncbi:MAG: ABC transporter permease [Streptosporangiales bacterium]|nr:ABC transporter permease [Streptosporangiales bacterium]